MPRPRNLAPPRARRAFGAHLLAPPALGPRAAPPPRRLPTRPFTPGNGARGSRGWPRGGRGSRSSWVQGRAWGLRATGRAHPAVFRESAAGEEVRDGEGASGERRQGAAPPDAGPRFRAGLCSASTRSHRSRLQSRRPAGLSPSCFPRSFSCLT